jgi:uncharacterized protein
MRLFLRLTCAVALTGGGEARAFYCGKAATIVEKAICASTSLKAQDDEMSALYATVKAASTPDERKMLAVAQKQWILEREEACGGSRGEELTSCIEERVKERLRLLRVAPESGPGTGRPMIPVFAAQPGDSRNYQVAFNLARFAQPASAGEKIFNATIAQDLGKAPVGRHHRSTGDHVLESDNDLTINYASPKFISAAEAYWSDDGGAHGNGGTTNINVDLASGKILEISDLLTEGAAASLARQCREQIIEQKKEQADQPYDAAVDSFLSDDVIAEHVATVNRWSFTETTATITFDAYAIGAYAEGTYECNFDMKALKAVALATAPLP